MVLSCHFRARNFRKVCVIADSNLVLVETSGKTTTKPPHVTKYLKKWVLGCFQGGIHIFKQTNKSLQETLSDFMMESPLLCELGT